MTRLSCAAAALFSAFGVLTCLPGYAQQIQGCARTDVTDPPRSVYNCTNGLVFETEAVAELLQPETALGNTPEVLQLNGAAAFFELPQGQGPFQIQTPYAIASVRGTTFVVDVQDMQTSVFVVEGVVAVGRADGSGEVELVAGEGVDVSQGGPMTVRQWPPKRSLALLARFAR